jgi:GT2 family glycosyltransferase
MISIIILTWDSESYIKRCVDSIIAEAKFSELETEILIFDNGSKDQTINILEKEYGNNPRVILEKFSENKGTTYPRNLGIKKAKGEYIMFLDSDTEIMQNSIKPMMGLLEEDKTAGIVCPRLKFPDGRAQESFRKFPTFSTKALRLINRFTGFFGPALRRDESYSEVKATMFPDYAISACWLMRKEIFERVGLLDEKIFYSPEDVDFCIRVWQAGYKVVFCPDAVVIHFCQRISYRKIPMAWSHFSGMLYLFKKHSYLFSRARLYRKFPARA